MSQVVTISFFSYRNLHAKVWAFLMMQFAHRYLTKTPGLTFYRLLGTGKGRGFNPWPDWGTYALLQVWESEKAAIHFVSNAKLMKLYTKRCSEHSTLFMRTMKSDGLWSGKNPFIAYDHLDQENPLLAVITRATIRKSKLLRFWSYVPTSEKPLDNNLGLIYTKGVGEVPFLQMATFSIWSDVDSLRRFAYQSAEHAKAIKLTKQLGWYSEELFARFQPYLVSGNWSGWPDTPYLKRLN